MSGINASGKDSHSATASSFPCTASKCLQNATGHSALVRQHRGTSLIQLCLRSGKLAECSRRAVYVHMAPDELGTPLHQTRVLWRAPAAGSPAHEVVAYVAALQHSACPRNLCCCFPEVGKRATGPGNIPTSQVALIPVARPQSRCRLPSPAFWAFVIVRLCI